jgi:hypothetical protein
VFGHQVLDGGDLPRFDSPFWEDEGIDPRSTTSRFFHQSGEGFDVEPCRGVVCRSMFSNGPSKGVNAVASMVRGQGARRMLKLRRFGPISRNGPIRRQRTSTDSYVRARYLEKERMVIPLPAEWSFGIMRTLAGSTLARDPWSDNRFHAFRSNARPAEESEGQTRPRHVSSEMA